MTIKSLKQFELRRETIRDDMCVFKGTEQECYTWMIDTIKRNNWNPLVLTDIHMRPVWDTGKAAFYLKEGYQQ